MKNKLNFDIIIARLVDVTEITYNITKSLAAAGIALLTYTSACFVYEYGKIFFGG